MMMHSCNPSTQRVETGRSGVQGQAQLHSHLSSQTSINRGIKIVHKNIFNTREQSKEGWRNKRHETEKSTKNKLTQIKVYGYSIKYEQYQNSDQMTG